MMIVASAFLVTLFPSGAAAQDTLSTAFFIMLFISPSVSVGVFLFTRARLTVDSSMYVFNC
jgi:hypothetical protein